MSGLIWSSDPDQQQLKSGANHLHVAHVIGPEVKELLESTLFVVVVVVVFLHDMWMVFVLLMLNVWWLQHRLFQDRSLYNNDT